MSELDRGEPVPRIRPSEIDQTAFVDREAEPARLKDHLDAVASGAGGVVLLAGEAGVGKTALVRQLVQYASACGGAVLLGRCRGPSEGSYAPVADALSASSLGFDALGNLLIGGGDFQGEQGFVSVVDQQAISAALVGGPIAPDSAELHLTPAGPTDFYNVRFNGITQEILIATFGSDTVYRYAIPAPGAGVGLLLGGAMIVGRRRRVAA